MNYKDKVYSIVEGYINKAAELTAWEKDLKLQKDAGTIARVKLEEIQADLRQQRSAAYAPGGDDAGTQAAEKE